MRFHFPIEPARCSINPRHFDRSNGRALYQRALDELALHVVSQRNEHKWGTLGGKIEVNMVTYVEDGRGVDVDACCKAVLDALQRGKAIVNDKNVCRLIATRVVEKPARIEVVVVNAE